MKKKPKSNDVVLRANDMKFSNGASYSGAIKDVLDSRPHGFGIYFYLFARFRLFRVSLRCGDNTSAA